MENEIQLTNGRKVKVKEIKFVDMLKIDGTNKEEATKTTLKLATDLTEEEIVDLSIKDGITVTKAVNDLNGFEDFQKL